jgi:RNA polymerase sigma-70 factor, ECF subfamily
VTSDEELMVSAAQGDTSAFEQIVLRYQALVWRVAYRFVGNPTDAQDITQIAFLKLFEAAPRYHPTALLKTYLFRIVHTTCIDHSRKNRPSTLDDPAEVPDDSPSAIDAMIMHEKEKGVKQAIEMLPPRQRSAITLRYEAELSIREIATILKVTEKAIERLLAHGRDTLFSLFNENRLDERGFLKSDSFNHLKRDYYAM